MQTTRPTVPALESIDIAVLVSVLGGCGGGGRKCKGCCQQQTVVVQPPAAPTPPPAQDLPQAMPQPSGDSFSQKISIKYQ
jgi:hypothetical protein